MSCAADLVLTAVVVILLKLLVIWLEPRMAFFPVRGVQETPATAGIATRTWRSRRRMARRSTPGGSRTSAARAGHLLARQRRESVDVAPARPRGAPAGLQRADGGLPRLWREHGPAERTGVYRDAEAAVRPVHARLRPAGEPGDLLGTIARVHGGGVLRRVHAGRAGAREPHARRARGAPIQPGAVAAQLPLVVPLPTSEFLRRTTGPCS
jgi:hypothetical protein